MTIAAVSTASMAPTVLLPLHPYTVIGFPAGYESSVEYRVLDIAKTIVQDWTNTDVVETATGVAGYSVYDVIIRLERGFQGLILWKIPGTTYHAEEPIDLTPLAYPTLLEMKLGGIALEATAQSRLAAADYVDHTAAISAFQGSVTRLLGLALENHVEDDVVRDGSGNKTSSVLYLYDSAANATAHVSGGGGGAGLIAKYQATFNYSAGRMTLNKVIRLA